MRECLASLALCFVTGHARYNKYTSYILLFHHEHCVCTNKLMLDVTMRGAVSVDIQEPDSAPGMHLSVLMLWSGCIQGSGLSVNLCPVNQKGTPGKHVENTV